MLSRARMYARSGGPLNVCRTSRRPSASSSISRPWPSNCWHWVAVKDVLPRRVDIFRASFRMLARIRPDADDAGLSIEAKPLGVRGDAVASLEEKARRNLSRGVRGEVASEDSASRNILLSYGPLPRPRVAFRERQPQARAKRAAIPTRGVPGRCLVRA